MGGMQVLHSIGGPLLGSFSATSGSSDGGSRLGFVYSVEESLVAMKV